MKLRLIIFTFVSALTKKFCMSLARLFLSYLAPSCLKRGRPSYTTSSLVTTESENFATFWCHSLSTTDHLWNIVSLFPLVIKVINPKVHMRRKLCLKILIQWKVELRQWVVPFLSWIDAMLMKFQKFTFLGFEKLLLMNA